MTNPAPQPTPPARPESGASSSPVAAPAQSSPASKPPALPGPGPAWFGSVMGTGILTTLLATHGIHTLATVMLVIAWTLLITLTVGYLINVMRGRAVFRPTFHQPEQAPAWGMVAMGILATGSATATVAGDGATWAWRVDGTTWVIGTVIGIFSATSFMSLLIRRDCGTPRLTWGLPVVAPMVSATVGAGWAKHISDPTWSFTLTVVALCCFVMALPLALTIFATAYHRAWFHDPIPAGATISTFIPLGIVGQSTAAAQTIALAIYPWLTPDINAVPEKLATGYGWLMMIAGIPLLLWAMYQSYRYVLSGQAFNPGWFASTFPVGTLSLGSHLMGWDGISLFFLALLAVHWTVCMVAAIRALLRQRAPQVVG